MAQCAKQQIVRRFVTTEPSPPPSASPTQDGGIVIDPEREVRFAVVMYGGVSLAIYINGVTQELLNMVRATARKSADPKEADFKNALIDGDAELRGTAGVYRKLGQYLGDRAKLARAAGSDSNGKPKPPSRDPIRTRFVVDVISGTSAGGINGVFLAKALARNQKMDGLKRLWLQEGDLSKLLNDSLSVSDLAGFSVQKPQQSLLNSQRMYCKLLEALEQMDEKAKTQEQRLEEKESPLVGELDLFITTTDIEGVPLPIKISDKVVYERRYKNVFHFRYATVQATGTKRDDFKRTDDPFLAFAARCTSSFPFAFEPMCLEDIDSVIRSYPRYQDTLKQPEAWDDFFSEYLRLGLHDLDKEARGQKSSGLSVSMGEATAELRRAFRSRSFGDGGYLDNKPFSHATSMLMRRHADVHVDRKLLYVEPSPEHPELAPENRNRPDFAENVRAAVLDLPRRETIREDIDRLYERNEMIHRIALFARDMDRDLSLYGRKEPLDDENFRAADLLRMLELYGIGYGAYHHLRVEDTTALLAELMTRIAGYDPSSEPAKAVRLLVQGWRATRFVVQRKNKEDQTENEFLSDLDIRYRLRRLIFLARRVNELGGISQDGRLDARALDLLRWWRDFSKSPALNVLQNDWVSAFRAELNRIKEDVLGPAVIQTRLAEEKLIQWDGQIDQKPLAPAEIAELSEEEKILYSARESDANLEPDKIEKLSEKNRDDYFAYRVRKLISDLDLPWTKIEELLECQTAKRSFVIKRQLSEDDRRKTLQMLTDTISLAFRKRTAADLRDQLQAGKSSEAGAIAARECLIHYYDNFTYYDFVTYPLQYGTGVGEANIVEVFRVSPEDATALFDEGKTGRTKLAGRALMSFGAFLDEGWRRNDMLWGRLDGAERLITTLLPPVTQRVNGECIDVNESMRTQLIDEAHKAILSEEIPQHDVRQISRFLSSALAAAPPGSEQADKFRHFVERSLPGMKLELMMQSALERCLTEPEKLHEFYQTEFDVDRRLDPETALRLMSRATTITGRMLERLVADYRVDQAKRVAHWITVLGSTFWNMIIVAVPGSLLNLFFRHWLAVLYVFSLAMIFAGTLLDANMNAFGWKALAVTAAINIVVAGLGYYMAAKKRWLQGLRILLGLGVIALIVCGGIFVGQEITALSRVNGLILGTIVAIPVLLFVGLQEWRNWRKQTRTCQRQASTQPEGT